MLRGMQLFEVCPCTAAVLHPGNGDRPLQLKTAHGGCVGGSVSDPQDVTARFQDPGRVCLIICGTVGEVKDQCQGFCLMRGEQFRFPECSKLLVFPLQDSGRTGNVNLNDFFPAVFPDIPYVRFNSDP